MVEYRENELFSELLRPSWKKPRFWIYTGFAILILLTFFFVKYNFIESGLTADELKRSIQFFDISSQWIKKTDLKEDDFTGILMVPQISFRIRNNGKKEMSYISFLAVFRGLYEGRSMGEMLVTAFKKPLKKGKESKKLVFSSNSGYRTPGKIEFKKMSDVWGKTVVEIYARSGRTQLTFLKSFFIRRLVEGTSSDVKIK